MPLDLAHVDQAGPVRAEIPRPVEDRNLGGRGEDKLRMTFDVDVAVHADCYLAVRRKNRMGARGDPVAAVGVVGEGDGLLALPGIPSAPRNPRGNWPAAALPWKNENPM